MEMIAKILGGYYGCTADGKRYIVLPHSEKDIIVDLHGYIK